MGSSSWFVKPSRLAAVGFQPFPHFPGCKAAGCAANAHPDAPAATTQTNPHDAPNGPLSDCPEGTGPRGEPLAEDVPPRVHCSAVRAGRHGSVWAGPEMRWYQKDALPSHSCSSWGAKSAFTTPAYLNFAFPKGRIHNQSCLSSWLCRGAFPQRHPAS